MGVDGVDDALLHGDFIKHVSDIGQRVGVPGYADGVIKEEVDLLLEEPQISALACSFMAYRRDWRCGEGIMSSMTSA